MKKQEILKWHKRRQQHWRAVPECGQYIPYCGKQFIVYPGVFWPFEDSVPLIENLKIKLGDTVLDVGTGSGVIATYAACKGAGRIVAIDINPLAVKAAQTNAKEHGFGAVIDTRVSDLFCALGQEKYDVITANLPWLDHPASDLVESAQWDNGFKTNKEFFSRVAQYLKPRGRIYFAQANYGAINKVRALASENRFQMRLLDQKPYSRDNRLLFYVFEIIRLDLS